MYEKEKTALFMHSFIKNVICSRFHKKKHPPTFHDISLILSRTFIYEPILINISMNNNITKTKFVCKFYVFEKFCNSFTFGPSLTL